MKDNKLTVDDLITVGMGLGAFIVGFRAAERIEQISSGEGPILGSLKTLFGRLR